MRLLLMLTLTKSTSDADRSVMVWRSMPNVKMCRGSTGLLYCCRCAAAHQLVTARRRGQMLWGGNCLRSVSLTKGSA